MQGPAPRACVPGGSPLPGKCLCPPGASGNTASEDFVYMAEKMGIQTGVNFEKLLQTAKYLREKVPGNYSGHHINIQQPQCTMG